MTRLWKNQSFTISLILALAPAASTAAAQQAIPVPSGQPVTLGEVLIDERPDATWVRFRFVAPRIGDGPGEVTYDIAAADMEHLCQYLVLPYLAKYALEPARVVISLSDRPVPFGTSDPQATQYFEAFRPEATRCIWEDF